MQFDSEKSHKGMNLRRGSRRITLVLSIITGLICGFTVHVKLANKRANIAKCEDEFMESIPVLVAGQERPAGWPEWNYVESPSSYNERLCTYLITKQFAGFKDLERALGMRSYFAHPYHSWERGTNENTNGLLRQFFPKGMDFGEITQADVDKATALLNNRPENV